MKQYLYIITGLPFAGKSTLAKELMKRFDCERTSVDKMMNKRHLEAQFMSQDDWDLVYREAYEELETLLRLGKTVAFDGGTLLKSERNTVRTIAEKCGVPFKLIFVDTPKEVIIKRRQKNLVTNERDHIVDEVMDTAFNMFEEPTEDEMPIPYHESDDLDQWVKDTLLSE